MSILGQADVDNQIFGLFPEYKYPILKLVCKSWYHRIRHHTPSDDTEECMNGCAWNGELHLIQWMRENGAPWTKGICSEAAYGGHLDILKWLRENGCPW